jgi:hypothetical protein
MSRRRVALMYAAAIVGGGAAGLLGGLIWASR